MLKVCCLFVFLMGAFELSGFCFVLFEGGFRIEGVFGS